MAKRVTLRQIGERAGVSSVAVGAALGLLSESSKVQLSPERAREIRRIAREMGYQRNKLARAFRQQRTNTIGVLFRVVSSPQRVSYMLDCIARGLMAQGYRPHLTPYFGRVDTLATCVEDLLGWRVDALVFSHLFQTDDPDNRWPEIEQQVRTAQTPMLFVESDLATVAPVTRISADIVGATRLAAEHLVSLGHRHLAYVNTGRSMNERRFAVVRDVASKVAGATATSLLLEKQIAADPIHELSEPSQAIGRQLATEPGSPTGIICANDSVAAGIIAGVQDAGRRVPEDLAVIGYDNSETAVLSRPQITTFQPPIEQLAEAAVSAILSSISDENKAGDKSGDPADDLADMLLPTRMIRRGSA